MNFSFKRGFIPALLLLVGIARADEWTFFHPELVTKTSYRVYLVDARASGENVSHEQYVCAVHADRQEVGGFDFTEGYFPPTEKGRHQADKACSRWMDKAARLIKRSREVK